MNAMDFQLHHDLAHIWGLIDRDPDVGCVVITGEGRAFSAGGEFDMIENIIADHDFRCKMWKDARTMIDLDARLQQADRFGDQRCRGGRRPGGRPAGRRDGGGAIGQAGRWPYRARRGR
ncbi:enoyl-CoA hydratase-related protein [Novosphingobium colocasiae]